VLPSALPEILIGCRTGLVLALITMITSEMIARQSGAGNILFNALDMGQYDTVFAMIIIVGAMGIGLDAAFEQFKALDADLAILAFVTLIVPERILYAPRYKSICFHPSLLPRHRGASGINWAIIAGDAETGVTWFWPDKGIDTGPILIQKRVPIADTDTVGSIYFNTLFPMGIDAMVEAVDLIKAGDAPAIVQDESRATYEPPCRDEHAKIDFAKPAREVFNLIRGCDPQPGAFANVGEEHVRLYEAGYSASKPDAAPGTIVTIDADGMKIALAAATLTIKRARIDPNPKKVAPGELAAAGEIGVGAKLT